MGRAFRGDLSGQIFGNLQVIRRHSRAANGTNWNYLCRSTIDGVESVIPDSNLYPPKALILRDARSRAKKRGTPFTIQHSDIIIPQKCPIFGLKLVVGQGRGRGREAIKDSKKYNTASLDEIVSGDGYVSGNVWVISWRANDLKKNASAEELTRIAQMIDAKTFLSPRAFQHFAENYQWRIDAQENR